jgi:hypothetical protein
MIHLWCGRVNKLFYWFGKSFCKLFVKSAHWSKKYIIRTPVPLYVIQVCVLFLRLLMCSFPSVKPKLAASFYYFEQFFDIPVCVVFLLIFYNVLPHIHCHMKSCSMKSCSIKPLIISSFHPHSYLYIRTSCTSREHFWIIEILQPVGMRVLRFILIYSLLSRYLWFWLLQSLCIVVIFLSFCIFLSVAIQTLNFPCNFFLCNHYCAI